MSTYVPRLVDPLVRDVLEDFPALLLVGPRACGKTTTARRVAHRMLRLDDPADAVGVRADPAGALAEGPYPLLVDEWQLVPAVLGAVKRSVDEIDSTARFVLTGSSEDDLAAAGWPGTGRVLRIPMYGLTRREIAGNVGRPPLLDLLARGDLDAVTLPPDPPDLRGYVEEALVGGFPQAVRASSEIARQRWLASYVDHVVTRDIVGAGVVRDPARLRRYLTALASATAGIPQHKTLFDAAQIDRRTAVVYDTVLEHLFITERLPAWFSNRLSRLTRLPKRHLVEPALVGPLLGVNSRAVLRDGDLLGRLLDSFVVAQVRAELPVGQERASLFHLRDANGRREIDLLAELAGGQVVAFEVKADSAPDRDAAAHLRWLRAQLGDRFAAGAVLHTGPRRWVDDGIVYLPICALWGP